MNRNTTLALILILLLAAVALYLVVPTTHPAWVKSAVAFWQPESVRSLDFRLGLDLQGGLQVLLVADLPDGGVPDSGSLAQARSIVERRVNALGLTEPVVQIRGNRYIVVELPGITNPEQAVDTIRGTALLEFAEPPVTVDFMNMPTQVRTTYGQTALTATETLTLPLFTTVMTGEALQDAYPYVNPQTGAYEVGFKLKSDWAAFFADYTSRNINQPLCIILDKSIISCPVIRSSIPGGEGTISGGFTYDGAESLAVQLRYGALPIPLRIESYRAIGPSLGQAAVEKSVRAGLIGLVTVLLFMLIYYRMNGLAANLALTLYVLLNLVIYKLAPVTLTLPGIAGFLLSAGIAVDANILVFERMKEELRVGRSLLGAAENGFARAWTSIRDSNLATLLTCAILFFFGNAFAAGMVKGFAITLALGNLVNIFTAIFVTRTFVRVMIAVMGERINRSPWLLGL